MAKLPEHVEISVRPGHFELQRRRREQAIAAPQPAKTQLDDAKGYKTQRSATSAAQKVAAPNTECTAELRASDNLWVPVVCLRGDQLWMARHIQERGVTVRAAQQPQTT